MKIVNKTNNNSYIFGNFKCFVRFEQLLNTKYVVYSLDLSFYQLSFIISIVIRSSNDYFSITTFMQSQWLILSDEIVDICSTDLFIDDLPPLWMEGISKLNRWRGGWESWQFDKLETFDSSNYTSIFVHVLGAEKRRLKISIGFGDYLSNHDSSKSMSKFHVYAFKLKQ